MLGMMHRRRRDSVIGGSDAVDWLSVILVCGALALVGPCVACEVHRQHEAREAARDACLARHCPPGMDPVVSRDVGCTCAVVPK